MTLLNSMVMSPIQKILLMLLKVVVAIRASSTSGPLGNPWLRNHRIALALKTSKSMRLFAAKPFEVDSSI